MIYTLIGRVVVKGAKVYLRRRYGPTYAPQPVIAAVVVAAIVGGAVIANHQQRDD